jgi:tetratricopeptide (TPR) repeat protein
MRLSLILLLIILTILGCRAKTQTELPPQLVFPPSEEALLPEPAIDAETAQNTQATPPQAESGNRGTTGVQVSRSLSELSALLPSFGVHTGELNPVNYKNADPAVLQQMGMEQYLISFLTAEKSYREGNYRDAISGYSRSISLKSDYTDALEGRGNAWLKSGDTVRAIEDYSLAINLKANRAEVYNYRGFVYAERGETEKAIADFSQALRLKPNYADALANRSRAFYMSGDYTKAIDDCTRLIALEPENFTAWNRRGSSWYSKQDDRRAIDDFSRAIAIKPDFALALHNRGNAWYSQGDLAKALADLENAIRIDPGFTAARTSRDYILGLLAR